jgi:hypothetical protein
VLPFPPLIVQAVADWSTPAEPVPIVLPSPPPMKQHDGAVPPMTLSVPPPTDEKVVPAVLLVPPRTLAFVPDATLPVPPKLTVPLTSSEPPR